jgi:hypothetical protein
MILTDAERERKPSLEGVAAAARDLNPEPAD